MGHPRKSDPPPYIRTEIMAQIGPLLDETQRAAVEHAIRTLPQERLEEALALCRDFDDALTSLADADASLAEVLLRADASHASTLEVLRNADEFIRTSQVKHTSV